VRLDVKLGGKMVPITKLNKRKNFRFGHTKCLFKVYLAMCVQVFDAIFFLPM